jgi:hypothetical protein
MVFIVLTPYKAGNHSRAFPFTGYLGFSPVSIQGAIRTKVEEDNKLVDACDIRVRARCYELDRSPSVARKPTVVCEFEHVVWRAGDAEYKPLGNFSSPFRIVIPPEAARAVPSTLAYKAWRVWWCLEGGTCSIVSDWVHMSGSWLKTWLFPVVNHRPSGIFGSRLVRSHHLALVRYGGPNPEPFRPWTDAETLYSSIDYVVSADSASYAAGDNVSVSLALRRSPRSPGAAVKKITLEIRRELLVGAQHNAAATSSDVSLGAASTSPISPGVHRSPRSSMDTATASRPARRISGWSLFGRSSTSIPPSPAYPSPRSPSSSASSSPHEEDAPSSYFCLPSKRSSTSTLGNRRDEVVLATTTRDSDISFDADGTWNGRIDCALPKRKNLYRYSSGESVSTPGASLRFFVCVRVSCVCVVPFLCHPDVSVCRSTCAIILSWSSTRDLFRCSRSHPMTCEWQRPTWPRWQRHKRRSVNSLTDSGG